MPHSSTIASQPGPRRQTARSAAATTLALAFVMGTSSVAGFQGLGTSAPVLDRLGEARAAARSYSDATSELAAVMARTAAAPSLDTMARSAIEGGTILPRAIRADAPDPMIADALAILGMRTERSVEMAEAADKRPRLGSKPTIDTTTTGSIVPAPRMRPTGPDAKRGRLIDTRSTETRIERAAKRGRLARLNIVSPSYAVLGAPLAMDKALAAFAPREAADFDIAAFSHVDGSVMVATALIAPVPVFAALPDVAPAPFTVARDAGGATVGTMLTAYAPALSRDYSARARFDALLQRKGSTRFVPQLGPKDHGWAQETLPQSVASAKEQRCLAIGIYFEARGEPKAGQAAVAQVILNRVRAPAFPNTACGVVYQNSHWRNRCQFSFTCDGIKDRIRSPKHWKIAQEVAWAATTGTAWFADVGSSTHYHADYVNPRWNRRMAKVAKIGRHIFYRTRRGGWD